MDTYYQHLQSLFNQLKATQLCIEKRCTQSNIDEFVKLLNLTIPINDCSKSMKAVMMLMFEKNKGAFINYLNITKTPYLSLILNGETIALFLNLMGIVYIKFNDNSGTYLVTPFHSKRQQMNHNTTGYNKFNNTKQNNKVCNVGIIIPVDNKELKKTIIPVMKFTTIDPACVQVAEGTNNKKNATALDILMNCSWSDT